MGAPSELTVSLLRCVGLKPDTSVASLALGHAQVFFIVKILLEDPDVICTYKPARMVPEEIRSKIISILITWQLGGGLPGIAEFLGQPIARPDVFRPPTRTLVIGNATPMFQHVKSAVHIDLNRHLWVGEGSDEAADATPQGEDPWGHLWVSGDSDKAAVATPQGEEPWGHDEPVDIQ